MKRNVKNLILKLITQSNVEGEIVSIFNQQMAFDGIIINAAAFAHTSVAIRDALEIFKENEVHISDI